VPYLSASAVRFLRTKRRYIICMTFTFTLSRKRTRSSLTALETTQGHKQNQTIIPKWEEWCGGRVSDLGSKGPGFDPRTVPKSECMFVVVSVSIVNLRHWASLAPLCKTRVLCYVDMATFCVLSHALSCVADVNPAFVLQNKSNRYLFFNWSDLSGAD